MYCRILGTHPIRLVDEAALACVAKASVLLDGGATKPRGAPSLPLLFVCWVWDRSSSSSSSRVEDRRRWTRAKTSWKKKKNRMKYPCAVLLSFRRERVKEERSTECSCLVFSVHGCCMCHAPWLCRYSSPVYCTCIDAYADDLTTFILRKSKGAATLLGLFLPRTCTHRARARPWSAAAADNNKKRALLVTAMVYVYS